MQELFKRFFSPTPDFFKKIRSIGLSIVALSTLVITMKSQGVILPEWLDTFLNWYTLTGGSIATFVSQLTQIWTNEQGIPLNSSIKTFSFEDAMVMVQDRKEVKRLVWNDSTYVYLVEGHIMITRNSGITYSPYESTIEDQTKSDWIGTTPKDR